jgi:dTDP-4-dehydrorhamnose 3,5-epimerase
VFDVQSTNIADVLEIRTGRIGDERGFFSEIWNRERWRAEGLPDLSFVQDNHSFSRRGVLRGLHYQLPPAAQAKLVRCSRGSVYDVAVDIRRSSGTFGQWVGRLISARLGNQLLIPEGFAHGFLALEEDSEVQYKVTATYSAAHDRAIDPSDPAIAIDWPLPPAERLLSAKDRAAPSLASAELFA